MSRAYSYIGPLDILQRVSGEPTGTPIRHQAELQLWIKMQPANQVELHATFVVDLTGTLLLADRQSEHVICAGGQAVLAAGELIVERAHPPFISQVTNQSTGYCPEPDCWEAVRSAIQRFHPDVPAGFSAAFIFRRCPKCDQINVVKENEFECSICSYALPAEWNF